MAIKELKTYGKTYREFTGGDNGIYISRVPDDLSIQKIVDMVHKHNLCQMSDKDIAELHCTIMYSPAGVVSEEVRKNDFNPIPLACSARVTHFEIWPGHDNSGYLVAILKSDALQHLHKLWKLRGCVSTFGEYKPHVTIQTPFEEYRGLSGNLRAANTDVVENGLVIRLGNETVEDIKKPNVVALLEAMRA